MFNTKFGPYDGTSWEALLQQVLKGKHSPEGYQEMPAAPGDFGLEGFTLESGRGFQCYCPDEEYDNDTLFKKQKAKIEADIQKLKRYESEIRARIKKPLRTWHFISPKINRHKLLVVARTEESVAKNWNLSILDPDFTIFLEDCDFYAQEIVSALTVNGQPYCVPQDHQPLPLLRDGPLSEYESNLLRKASSRIAGLGNTTIEPNRRIQKLYALTRTQFLEHDDYFKELSKTAPAIHIKVLRILAQVQSEIELSSVTWSGSPEELVRATAELVEARLDADLGRLVERSTIARLSQLTLARWLAVCQLDVQA